jgi:hypothetical protein
MVEASLLHLTSSLPATRHDADSTPAEIPGSRMKSALRSVATMTANGRKRELGVNGRQKWHPGREESPASLLAGPISAGRASQESLTGHLGPLIGFG